MGKKGKKKKGAKEAIGSKASPAEEHMSLSLQVETLERELQVKSAQAETALREEIELRAKVDQMEEDFKGEQSTTFAVTADMARQYKALQEELIYKINSLETQLTEQKEELDITNHELQELIRDKDDDIEHKDEQIRLLNQRMNEMSTEFANMLSETLELMRSHIKEKLADGVEDDSGKQDFMQRLQDYSTKAYNAVSVSTRPGAGGSGDKALANGEATSSG
mmetsp:Transcript_82974/g.185240  ORF Transcript_82974/g.185240 Transcript_82974/m.185240 type:complete len:222 (-) Transcript_82974:54-719(-)